MTHYVTIEGSLTTPTDRLPRGVRRTVAVTDDVRRLIAIGGAIVVDGSLDGTDIEPVAEVHEIPDPAPGPPPGNASRDDWAEWVAANMPGAVTDGKGRDELREIWQQASGGS